MRKFVPFAILFLISASATFAGGPKHSWAIMKVDGNTITVVDENGTIDNIDGNNKDMAGLRIFFGVKKDAQLSGRCFSGDDLAQTVNVNANWGLHMTPLDKKVEKMVNGIILFKDVEVSKKDMLSASTDFVGGQYLSKEILGKMFERVGVRTNGKCELAVAKASDFTVLPKALCFTTLEVRETIMMLMSAQTPDGVISIPSAVRSERIHRFTIAADCTNAVQFDKMELASDEMNETHAP